MLTWDAPSDCYTIGEHSCVHFVDTAGATTGAFASIILVRALVGTEADGISESSEARTKSVFQACSARCWVATRMSSGSGCKSILWIWRPSIPLSAGTRVYRDQDPSPNTGGPPSSKTSGKHLILSYVRGLQCNLCLKRVICVCVCTRARKNARATDHIHSARLI